jgi:hypothetical protein
VADSTGHRRQRGDASAAASAVALVGIVFGWVVGYATFLLAGAALALLIALGFASSNWNF